LTDREPLTALPNAQKQHPPLAAQCGSSPESFHSLYWQLPPRITNKIGDLHPFARRPWIERHAGQHRGDIPEQLIVIFWPYQTGYFFWTSLSRIIGIMPPESKNKRGKSISPLDKKKELFKKYGGSSESL
jgi:hypothetical protein